MNPRTIAVLRKMKTTQGLPLLSPNLSEAAAIRCWGEPQCQLRR
jgi:HK97 family phage major capsid protein